MPKIRLLNHLNIAGDHHVQGDVVDVDGDVASYLVGLCQAELVRGKAPENPEAAAPKRETAARKSSKRS